jgi:hypothetical protein
VGKRAFGYYVPRHPDGREIICDVSPLEGHALGPPGKRATKRPIYDIVELGEGKAQVTDKLLIYVFLVLWGKVRDRVAR